jgi:hypothetical protein
MMKKFDNKMLRWILLGALGLSVVLFFAIMVEGMSLLSSRSQQLVDLKVKSETADAQLSNLEQAKKDVEKYSYFKDVAKTVIPNDKDQAEAVLEINQMASQSGIAIQSITFPASNLGISTPSTGGTTSAANPAASPISQATPVTGIPGLYSLQLTITPAVGNDVPPAQQVTYAKMLDFLNRIENNRHTAQITQVNIQPGTNNLTVGFTLVVNIFIKP